MSFCVDLMTLLYLQEEVNLWMINLWVFPMKLEKSIYEWSRTIKLGLKCQISKIGGMRGWLKVVTLMGRFFLGMMDLENENMKQLLYNSGRIHCCILGVKISDNFSGVFVINSYNILFCFGAYEVFDLFLDVV